MLNVGDKVRLHKDVLVLWKALTKYRDEGIPGEVTHVVREPGRYHVKFGEGSFENGWFYESSLEKVDER